MKMFIVKHANVDLINTIYKSIYKQKNIWKWQNYKRMKSGDYALVVLII
jgi:hypothetical protein